MAGVIAAESDPPGLDRARFTAFIAEHPSLTESDDASACVVTGGAIVGQLRWSQAGARELDVYGEVDEVADVAWDVAHALGGRFVTLAELTSC